MVCAYRLTDNMAALEPYLNSLRLWQEIAPTSDHKGIAATFPDSLRTGIVNPNGSNWCYYDRLHLGATAWYIFSENTVNYNPFWLDTLVLQGLDMKSFRFQIYPNPTDQDLMIHILLSYPARLIFSIYDIKGHQVKSTIFQCSPGKHLYNIPVNTLPPGVYILQCIVNDNISGVKKIVIK
jgi:hypothetical protein